MCMSDLKSEQFDERERERERERFRIPDAQEHQRVSIDYPKEM